MNLSYEKKGNMLLVSGDRKKYEKVLKDIGAVWDKSRNLWLAPKDLEKNISDLIKKENISSNIKSVSSQKKYIKDIEHDILNSSSDEDEEDVEIKPKNSKTLESDDSDVSESEDEEDEEDEDEDETEDEDDTDSDIDDKKLDSRRKYSDILQTKKDKTSNKYTSKIDHKLDNLLFTKDSAKVNRRQRSSASLSSRSLSSSSRSSSSEDDFPSPETPKKRISYIKNNNTKNYDTLINQISDLQKRVLNIEKRK
jgi:hypothetical protein